MDYFNIFQSGFRPGYNIKMTLIVLVCDLWILACRGDSFFFLTLLDLLASFDTLSHDILLDQLMG